MTHPQSPPLIAVAPFGKSWFRDAQKAHKEVETLKNNSRKKVYVIEKTTKGQTAAQKKTQGSDTAIGHKRALRETGSRLKSAEEKFEEQVTVQAKRQCLSLCEKVMELPRELRNMVYNDLITERNATFFHGPDKKVKLVNGTSTHTHCFNADFTGSIMHGDIVQELNSRGVRFDFRHRHGLLAQAVEEYASLHGLDLTATMKGVGVTLNLGDVKGCDLAMKSLGSLLELPKNTGITVFIEASGRTQPQIARSFRRVVRSVVASLHRLKIAGHEVTVILNPSYARSAAKNGDESRFSIIHAQDFRYVFPVGESETSSKEMEGKLQKVLVTDA
ncbi:hypothetical protein HBI56_053290 [Parastagonospora nodorum]|nr:hypothetical protein HBH53_182800 [Parastagonospora nodorum]KAH3981394.1 hypothetical protein HBH52_086720 [Parastagonospora nodorum]KAH4002939.1 hypothetical protein HBI10_066280 [Parastagonospora nodorum]KAH4022715.1 hypothetical protein HBI09_166730 [Parastagonospora nodorum]KAH4028191.1 hypothetical protein HBI13_051780 [Parastagonospora nodorum]